MAALNEGNGCKIWQGHQARFTFSAGKFVVENSPRAGGSYVIGLDENGRFANQLIDDSAKARLTTMLINLRLQGVRFPEVTRELIEAAKNAEPMSVQERADRLLENIANLIEGIGHWVIVPYLDPLALAYSESVNDYELDFLLNYLRQQEWIDGRVFPNGSFECTLTVNGFGRIADRRESIDSTQAFVAMWFDPTMMEIYEKGIAPAIEQAGYKPYTVNRDDYIGDITDKIIAEIRRSKFLVADFTHGKTGVRGGVYYEAGFAHGLNKPVIPTCKKESVDNDPRYLHFDTSHLNHILWTDAADLREKLTNRILAVLDEGPNKQQS